MRLDNEETRNAFWNGIGCIFTSIIGLVSGVIVIIMIVIPIIRNGHVESTATCQSGIGDVRYELVLVQDGLEWRKEITSRIGVYSEYQRLLVQAIHDPQIGVFSDVTQILWCSPRGGIIVRGTIKGSSISALFWIDIYGEARFYGELVP